MTATDFREKFFRLFLRHGLIPEPVCVTSLRNEANSALAAMEAMSSRDAGFRNVADWEAEKVRCEEQWRADLESARSDIRNYSDWSPSAEDWVRIAIALAVEHGEDGFKLEIPREERSAEQNWHRDNLISKFAERGMSAAEAAKAAEEEIRRLQRNGQGDHYGKALKAKSLESAYSARQAPINREIARDKQAQSELRREIVAAAKERDSAWSAGNADAAGTANKRISEIYRSGTESHRSFINLLSDRDLPWFLEVHQVAGAHFSSLFSEAMSISESR
ncbi:hypothetical protein [Novosphingobium mathurense]|uniref:Uncharacterized protein n=1 Tax=Novosphingobium mathurense TaxID=428990 RepID=A0A1U6GXS7_9SPHN|nr:hypothetical protein [Novosphingobium mathurense]SLJ88349.1 hypothetical protein SAMN06295987_101791 [Novosphingobium mathurense]